jgi:hypothetical protein
MANKKKDFNMAGQGLSFISAAHQEEPEQGETLYVPDVEPVSVELETGKAVNKGGRPKSRGEVRRASVFLDADLEVALKIQAAIEHKSVSVLISDVMRQYLIDKGRFEDLQK